MMENQYWQQLVISLFITFFAYLTVPFCIYRYCENRCSPFFANWRRHIIIWNCVAVWCLINTILFLACGYLSPNVTPAFVWGFIAFRLFNPNEIIFPPESLRKNKKRKTVNPAPESAPQTVHNTDRENLPCSSLPAVKEIEQEQQSTQTPPSDPILPEPPKANKSEHSSLGIKKTTVYCCKACGCVIKKGTRVCPHCGAYIGPNKVRNARILAGVCAVLLCISLAGNFGLSLYVWELNNKVATVSAAAEEVGSDFEILQSELNSYKDKYRQALNQKNALLKDVSEENHKQYNLKFLLEFYTENIALINYFGQSSQYYHTVWCNKLNDNFYIYTVKNAESMSCFPCPDCHSQESLDNMITP